jgi:MOSC domain-containing protein YiiM
MRVVSINVGMPREVAWQGETVLTGIFKEPVAGPVALRTMNLDGDRQADLTVHGGRDKAVYAYPLEHYSGWEQRVGRRLAPGAFGENLTTEGLLEEQVHIGDEFRIGTARLIVTQPRMPCYKLGIRFGDPSMVKTFHKSGLPGIYFSVAEEGTLAPDDPIELLRADERRVSVTAMLAQMSAKQPDVRVLSQLLEIPGLAAVWREEFKERLAR